MKKQILLLLLILHPIFAPAMDESIFSRISLLSSYVSNKFSSNKKPKESELITNLRANKVSFENQLELHIAIKLQKTYTAANIQLFPVEYITSNPALFLSYCYHQKHHKTEDFGLDILITFEDVLSKCLKAQINGYSALGAAMIGDESPTEKQKFIQKLIDYNFKPTIEDICLAELIFYDEIVDHHEMLILLLQYNAKSHLHILPKDVRNYIVHIIIQLLKKEAWPLSKNAINVIETTDNNFTNDFHLIKQGFFASFGF